jgi:CheY-like chemotaxis protein
MATDSSLHRPEDFLAVLSHELRNPLAPIRNAVQVLKLLARGDTKVESVQSILDRQVLHLSHLLDDLLDVYRITAGLMRLQPEIVPAGSIVARAVEATQPSLHERRLTLTFDPPREESWVEGDGPRLSQALGNVLDNAVQRSRENGRVRLRWGAEKNQVFFRVRDRGTEIPAATLPRLFELFVDSQHAPSRRGTGFGVGLPLARMLVEMHRGAIEAHSDGSGSEFVVRLPAARAPRAAAPPPVPSPRSMPAPMPAAVHRVLVLDDNVDAAESLGLLLALAGHAVHVAHDGPSAITAARAQHPDVVLLDIGLPGMDGYAVARELRQLEGMETAMLIAVSGFEQDSDRLHSREAGIDRHLVKPIDPAELQILLGKLPGPGS